eukprot:1399890-Pleurochrysis_carterae.AAC.1
MWRICVKKRCSQVTAHRSSLKRPCMACGKGRLRAWDEVDTEGRRDESMQSLLHLFRSQERASAQQMPPLVRSS